MLVVISIDIELIRMVLLFNQLFLTWTVFFCHCEMKVSTVFFLVVLFVISSSYVLYHISCNNSTLGCFDYSTTIEFDDLIGICKDEKYSGMVSLGCLAHVVYCFLVHSTWMGFTVLNDVLVIDTVEGFCFFVSLHWTLFLQDFIFLFRLTLLMLFFHDFFHRFVNAYVFLIFVRFFPSVVTTGQALKQKAVVTYFSKILLIYYIYLGTKTQIDIETFVRS